MKIGVVIDTFNVGGVEKIALEQVSALRKKHIDAQLLVLRKRGEIPGVFKDLAKNIPVVYLDDRLPRILRFSFRFPVFHFFSLFHLTYAFYLPFVVKKQEFDYFIGHGTYTCFSLMTIKKVRKIHYSAFIWDPVSYILERVYQKSFFAPILWILRKVAGVVDRAILKSMDAVLVGGDAHDTLIQTLVPGKEIITIYPSVHPIKKQQKKGNFAVMATAWKKGKNPEYITEVAESLPELHIKLVGKWLDSQYQKEFEQLLKSKNLQRRIDIVGEVTEKELTYYYSKALFVLQTNDDRGFGMPALEAAGHGTAFIIPKDQGVCKLFKNGHDGYYTKERDTPAISKLANGFLQHPQQAIKMGENGLEKVTKNYSWDKHATSLLELASSKSVRT